MKKVINLLMIFFFCVNLFGNEFILPKNVNLKTLKVYSESLLLNINEDYFINNFEVVLLKDFENIKIDYETFNYDLYQQFRLFEPIVGTDSLDIKQILNKTKYLDNSNVNINGFKTISLSLSNTSSMSINQSLFLRMQGELANNIQLLAQIQDNNSAFTTDGTTKELSNLDELFIKIYGKEYEIAFGDLQFETNETNFINYKPKFSGLLLKYFDKQKISGAISMSSTKPAFIKINGIEGIQGPYYLKPNEVSSNVKIIPGTDIIWLNGKQIERGTDYKIDYNEGYIEFNIKNFISKNSQIQASFQYSDEFYKKKSIYASTEINISKNLKLSSDLIFTEDDKENPISGEKLNYEDRFALTNNSNSIFVSGITYVGNNLGSYKKIFSGNLEFYEYAKDEDDANYDILFSFFGHEKGDYKQIAPNIFKYIGENLGEWLPLKEIKSPELKANYDFSLTYNINNFNLKYETLLSEYNQNTFENKKNISHLHFINAIIEPSTDLIKSKISGSYLFKNKNLKPFSQIPEHYLDYTMQNTFNSDSLKYHQYQANFKTEINKLYEFEGYTVYTNFNEKYKEKIVNLENSFIQQKYFPKIKHRFYLYLWNDFENKTKKVMINEPSMEYIYKMLTFSSTNKFMVNKAVDENSELNNYNLNMTLNKFKKGGVNAGYSYENQINEFSFEKNKIDSETYSLQSFLQFENHFFNSIMSHKLVNNKDKEVFDVAEVNSVNSFFNKGLNTTGAYILKNLEFFPRSRELIYIGSNAGLYDSTGVFTSNGDYDYISVISGDTQKSIDVLANFNIYTNPGNFIINNPKLKENLDRFSLETLFNKAQQTIGNKRMKIYLLQNDDKKNVIYVNNDLKQTIWYNVIKQKILFRYSLYLNDVYDNRYGENYKSSLYENEMALSLLTKGINDYEISFKNKKENDAKYVSKSVTNSYSINIKTTPTNDLIFTSIGSFDWENLESHDELQKIERLNFSEEIVYFWGSNFKINSLFKTFFNNNSKKINYYLPVEKLPGFSYNWSFDLNYKINNISSLNFLYSGNKNPQFKIEQQVKMEFKAEF